MPTPVSSASPEPPPDRRRRVVDGDRTWRVYEEDNLNGESTLVFDCLHTIRRVWQFPADWASRTDSELLEICHRPVQRRPGPRKTPSSESQAR